MSASPQSAASAAVRCCVFVALLAAMCIDCSDAIKCYSCTGDPKGDCGKQFKPDPLKVQNYPKDDACCVVTVRNYSTRKTTVSRGSARGELVPLGPSAVETPGCHQVTTGGTKTIYCICQSELCNTQEPPTIESRSTSMSSNCIVFYGVAALVVALAAVQRRSA